AIGMVGAMRWEQRAYKEREIRLLESFADQTVIAISNAELFQQLQKRNRDLTEALAQQSATAEVLQTISRSAFDLQHVLDTLVESAHRLCATDMGFVGRLQDDVLHIETMKGATPEFEALAHELNLRPGREGVVPQMLLERRPIHIPDVLADPDYGMWDVQRVGGYRVLAAFPLMRQGELIGAFALNRTRPEPFTDAQIKLMAMFADQAVIAISNAELFRQLQDRNRELSDALAQQVATSEVLQTISRSAFELRSVLETLLENAVKLCGAEGGNLARVDGGV